MFQHLILEKHYPLAKIIFNRPAKKNSMIPEMGEEVALAVSEINQDEAVRVVIVTGAGDSFSAGGDLNMIIDLTKIPQEESYQFMTRYYRNYFSLQKLQMPTIAMMNGHAIGAGLCISLACDLRLIAEQAKVGVTFVKVGLNGGMGGSYMLPRMIGLARASELLFTGKLISAQRAYEMGLVNYVYPLQQLEEETRKLAVDIASHAPQALKYTKRSLLEGLSTTLDHVFELESQGQSICYKTEDILEGVASTKEKRKARFTGR
ncbi:enoyl-CoA hydratase/isomerase family protein [candidate division CSSED10-310 bacterium]|uniref:Enoyl-CoA hydratase/isomerase family protein n=1 Tax=candidate division CSSED10-310 bacterium TaxID=2855610 RepID=A0ABV6YY72_UNCC1